MVRYQHTQTGYLIIGAFAVAIFFTLIVLAVSVFNWAVFVALIICGLSLVLFSSLTVTIEGKYLKLYFGPGLIRKKFNLDEIESCKAVRNPWYYGWGIHHSPKGWVFNVSGFDAVEIKLKTGKSYRIGTDVPRELEKAVNKYTSSRTA